MDTLIGYLVLAVIGAFVWVAWPVSIWFIGILIGHYIARRSADWLEARRITSGSNAFTGLIEIIARTLSRSTAWVAVGVGLVCIAQAGLWVTSEFISPEAVRSAEDALSAAYQVASRFLDLQVMVIALAVLLGFAMLAPRSGVVETFVRLRSALSSIALVLLAVTSFTFFSGVELNHVDPEWRRAERWRAEASLRQIDGLKRDLAATAWVEQEIRRLDEPQRKEFSQTFSMVKGTSFPQQILRGIAVELGEKAPAIALDKSRSVTAAEELVPARVRAYVAPQPGHVPLDLLEQPTLSELRSANHELRNAELRLKAAHTAATEVVAELLSGFMPQTEKALVNHFIQDVSSAVAKGALQKLTPANVSDLSSAREWVQYHATGTTALSEGRVSAKWAFHPSAIEARTGASGIRTSEALILGLIARHNALQMQRSVRPPMGSVHVPTRVSAPRVRVRF